MRKPEGKRLSGRPGFVGSHVTVCLEEAEFEVAKLICMARDRNTRSAVVNRVMNLRVSQNAGIYCLPDKLFDSQRLCFMTSGRWLVSYLISYIVIET